MGEGVTDGDALPGLDLDRLRAHLDEHSPGLVTGPLRGSVITGGRSNLTYDVTDGTTPLVVRRPPLGHVLATAHDMGREYRVITSLAATEVPVPRTYHSCTDADAIGAPFYVMHKEPGTAFRHADTLSPLGEQRVRSISERLVDTLVDLHAVDPAAIGLADFGNPEGFSGRQVSRWTKQLESSRSRDLAGVDELRGYLESHVPTHSDATIVHGDFRLDNVLVDTEQDGDPLTAVLDWEMATLGDPLTDVALSVAYQELATQDAAALVADSPLAPGYLPVDQVLERYSTASGRDLSQMGFYLALAYYKLAVILEGIHYRYVQGKTVGPGFERIGSMTEPLVAAGLDARSR